MSACSHKKCVVKISSVIDLFVDDLTLATQVESFVEAEMNLGSGVSVKTMRKLRFRYFTTIRPRREFNGYLNGGSLTHNNPSMYLRILLDRSLTYKLDLEQRAKELSARNNLIQKLAETS